MAAKALIREWALKSQVAEAKSEEENSSDWKSFSLSPGQSSIGEIGFAHPESEPFASNLAPEGRYRAIGGCLRYAHKRQDPGD